MIIPPTAGLYLAIALAASLAGNVAAVHAYLGARDARATAQTEAKNSAGLAQACSDGVESLRAAAETRATRAQAAASAAQAAQRVAESRVQGLLGKTPTVPGNACASAAAQIDDWLATRGAK